MPKFGYRDITDVTLSDPTTGNPVIFMDYLQTASHTYGNEVVYQLGGRGAPKLVGFIAKNSMKMEFTSALLNPEMLGIMFGTDVVIGTQNVPVTQVISTATNTFNLAATPVNGTVVTVAYTADGTIPSTPLTLTASTPTATQFSISGTTVTVNSSTYANGGTFLCTYYQSSTASNKRVRFASDKFTKQYTLTGYTLFKNTSDGKMYPCRITIPMLQIEINGAVLNSVMDGNATTLKFSGEALKPVNSTDLVIYDIDEGAGF